jgi:hypothetical protein
MIDLRSSPLSIFFHVQERNDEKYDDSFMSTLKPLI